MYRTPLAVAAFVGILLSLCVRTADTAAPLLDAETMKAALDTATPEENGFIDRVVELVEKGDLPASLVDSTFQWARKKPRHKFQYFKRALILRARRIGIELSIRDQANSIPA
jgi:hypothetical protein